MVEIAQEDRRYVIVPHEGEYLLIEAVCVQYVDPDAADGRIQKPWMLVTSYASREALMSALRQTGCPPSQPLKDAARIIPITTISAKEIQQLWEGQ